MSTESRRADRQVIRQTAEVGLLDRARRSELSGLTISELIAEQAVRHEVRSPDDVLLAVVAGARAQAERLRVIELEAARQARMCGVAVRRLAQVVGMSERSAHDRYRKPRIRIDHEVDGEDRVAEVGLYGTSTDLEIVSDLLRSAGIEHTPQIIDGHGWAPNELGGLLVRPADEAAAIKVLDENFFGVERRFEGS
jgi:hypothetical protein